MDPTNTVPHLNIKNNGINMIKIYKYCAVLLSILSMSFSIAASDSVRTQQANSTLTTTPNEIFKYKYSIGIEIFPYIYREPNVMRSKGVLYGVNGSYAFYLGKDYYMQLDGRAIRGKTDYSSKKTGSNGTEEPNKLFETRLLINRHFQLYDNLDINPFFGFGYRYKEDDSSLNKSSTGHIGYLRRSSYYYMPIGLSVNYKLPKGWNVFISGEYDFLLEGEQLSYIPFETIKNKQHKGYGVRSEILFEKSFDEYIISVGPYINYWNISNSKKHFSNCIFYSCFFEPKNNTVESGIKLKITI